MSKIQKDLIQEINDTIKTNSTGAITGPVMNGVLNDMTNTLYGSNFLFPAEPGLSDSDIGKLVMNDGSGTAKVYKLAAPTTETLGEWVITPLNFGEFSSDNLIQIETTDNKVTAVRSNWLQGRTMPTTVAQELGYIKDYLQSNTYLTGLSFNSDGTSLTIQEQVFLGTTVYVSGFMDFPLSVIKDSVPALPAAPAYYPLGKLIGVDGTQAMISCNPIQEYTLAVPGSINVMNSLFSYTTDLSFQIQTMDDLVRHIILPADNGLVTPVIVSNFSDIHGSFLSIFRFHFVGIAIGSTSTSVTVFNLASSSFAVSIFIKLMRSGELAFNNLLTK